MKRLPAFLLLLLWLLPAVLRAQDHHAAHDMHEMQGMQDDAQSSAQVQAAAAPPLRMPTAAEQAAAFPPHMHAAAAHMASAPFTLLQLERLEWAPRADSLAWQARASWGSSLNRLVLESEGEHEAGDSAHKLQLYGSHALSRWWALRANLRQDTGPGPARYWAGLGVSGLLPFWLDTELNIYAGADGRTALSLEMEYDARLTQRLLLQPRLALMSYGKADPETGHDQGLDETELGLRLRYEIRREIAPYLGLLWQRRYQAEVSGAQTAGTMSQQWQAVLGLQAWW